MKAGGWNVDSMRDSGTVMEGNRRSGVGVFFLIHETLPLTLLQIKMPKIKLN